MNFCIWIIIETMWLVFQPIVYIFRESFNIEFFYASYYYSWSEASMNVTFHNAERIGKWSDTSLIRKRKWQMQSLNMRTKPVVIANKRLKRKILGQNFSNISLDQTQESVLNCCMGRNGHS